MKVNKNEKNNMHEIQIWISAANSEYFTMNKMLRSKMLLKNTNKTQHVSLFF